MNNQSESGDVALDPLIALRVQMAAEGWESEDRMSATGWRAGVGYSIWFERWEWHGQNTLKLTGSRACYHAHVGPPLNQASVMLAAKEAAARARDAYENFKEYPPQQMADGTLRVCRIPMDHSGRED